jgi:hypothetical protein
MNSSCLTERMSNVHFYLLPPAAREPFYKRVPWTLPKFFIRVFFIALFLRVPSRAFAVKKISGGFRLTIAVDPVSPLSYN